MVIRKLGLVGNDGMYYMEVNYPLSGCMKVVVCVADTSRTSCADLGTRTGSAM